MALTTTTGLSGSRPLTMRAAWSIALASCTEVPPNFMTIMAVEPCAANRHRWGQVRLNRREGNSSQVALHFQKLGVQHGCPGSSPDGVVRQNRKPPIENITRTQAPDRRSHSRPGVNIQPRLRAV